MVRRIVIALQDHQSQILSTRESQLDASDAYWAPRVLGIEAAVWKAHSRKALSEAGAIELGASTKIGSNGEYDGGKWFYIGTAPSCLKHKRGMPESDEWVDITATIGVGLFATPAAHEPCRRRPDSDGAREGGAAVAEEACAPQRAPLRGRPTTRTPGEGTASKRARPAALADAVPLTARLLERRLTRPSRKPTCEMDAKWCGEDGERKRRLEATLEAICVINLFDVGDTSAMTQTLLLIAETAGVKGQVSQHCARITPEILTRARYLLGVKKLRIIKVIPGLKRHNIPICSKQELVAYDESLRL